MPRPDVIVKTQYRQYRYPVGTLNIATYHKMQKGRVNIIIVYISVMIPPIYIVVSRSQISF